MGKKEETYRLTEQGEAHAVSLLGGQDIANVAGAFLHLMKTKGDAFGTKMEDEGDALRFWLKLISLLKVIRHCKNWESLVVTCEKLLEKESDWFKHHPHSVFWDFSIEPEGE